MSKKSTKKGKPAPKAKAAAKAKAKPAPAKKSIKAKAKPAPAKAKPAVKSKPKAKAPVKKVIKKAVSKSVAKASPKAPVKPAAKVAAKPVAKAPVKATPKPVEKKPVQTSVPKPNPTESKPAISKHMPFNKKPEPSRQIVKAPEESGKNRYSDKELEEFREIIMKKLENARRELVTLQAQLTAANEHGTDDTASTFKMLEDGSDSLAKEEAGQLASRQKKFIEQLENALVRIENKTYGICRVTGKLIPKERLRAVPHTTQSIEAKLKQFRD